MWFILVCVTSLLSGAANGAVAIHDLDVVPPTADSVLCTYPVVSSVDIQSDFRHRGSVETVQWYPFDTGMFVSSGTDRLVKVWDTNILRVRTHWQYIIYRYFILIIVIIIITVINVHISTIKS